MFLECLPQLPHPLCGFSPILPQSAGQALPYQLEKIYLQRGVAAQKAELPQLLLSDWLRFSDEGDRSRYENAYFARRRRLTDLAMAECCQNEGRFLPQILDTIWAICEESAWQLPAHNAYLRDETPHRWPNPEAPVVDLFAAETGALLAVCCTVLGQKLEQPLLQRVQGCLDQRLVQPYLTKHFWWKGNGDEAMCNWTPWCTQNMLLVAFCSPQTDETRRKIVQQAAYSLDCFLKDYETDGCCNEGAQYYGHAALCLFGCLEILCSVAPGTFDALWQTEKIRNMACYIRNMQVDEDWYINFSDCSPIAGRRSAREFLFGQRTNQPDLAQFAAQDWAQGLATQPNDDVARINLWYQLLEAICAAEMLAQPAPRKNTATSWYPSVGILVVRKGAFCMAAKAGNNADNHNHNDTGSVTLYKNGRPFLIDLGVETYCKKTFSPQRYDIWAMQSSWHNLPEFDPHGAAHQQKPGAQFCAKTVQRLQTETADGLAMDIAPAYGAVAGLGYYRRRVTASETGVILHDETDYPGTVALTLMSAERPKQRQPAQADGCKLQFGALGKLVAQGDIADITIEEIPITDARLAKAWQGSVFRTRVFFVQKITLKIE